MDLANFLPAQPDDVEMGAVKKSHGSGPARSHAVAKQKAQKASITNDDL